jgi:hypothetical protein
VSVQKIKSYIIEDNTITMEKLSAAVREAIGSGGSETTFTIKNKTFTATAGQTLFSISDVGSYQTGKNYLWINVGNVPQSGNFTETSSTSFTLPGGVEAGVKVFAWWFEGVGTGSGVTSEFFHVSDYGAAGNGTDDDTSSINSAVAAMGTSKRNTLVFSPGKTYKVSGTITLNPSYHSVQGNGAKILATTMTTGYVFDFIGTVYPPYGQNLTIIEGLKIQGAGETSSLKCFKLASSNSAGASRITFRNIVLYDFGEGVTFGNASYMQNFSDCEFYNLGRALYFPSSTDAGERISFRGCGFYNSNSILEAADGDGSMMFSQCSFDYNVKNMVLSGGFKAFMSQCHIEGDTSSSELFTTTGSGTSIYATDCWFISVTGTGAYSFFNIGSSGNGALRIRNCFVNNLPTSRIAVGTGMIDIQGLNGYGGGDKHYVPADRMSYLSDPSFEGSNSLDAFTQTKSGTGTIAVDATTANTGTRSIKFTKPLTTDACYMEIIVPIRNGQRIFVDYFHKYTSVVVGGTGAESWFFNVQYRDAANVVLGFGETTLTGTLGTFSRANVTYFRDTPPPRGTANVKLRFGLTGTSTGTGWIDDLTINVC